MSAFTQFVTIRKPKSHFQWVLVGAAMIASFPGAATLAAQMQAKDACSLLRSDEVQALASSTHVPDGVSTTDNLGAVVCTYRWGSQYVFQIANGDPARMFPAMTENQIKQALLKPVKDGTAVDVAGVADAAAFKSDSPTKADLAAYIKGRVLTLTIDAPDARSRKDQLIAMLKIAAGRL
jgi:hypothetical protein